MDKITPLPAKKVIKALEKIGFLQIRQKGSHLLMRHSDGRTAIVPVHHGEDVGKGLIRKIISDTKIKREEWLELVEDL